MVLGETCWVREKERGNIKYVLENNKFVPQKPYTSGDIYLSRVLDGFEIEIKQIFENSINLD